VFGIKPRFIKPALIPCLNNWDQIQKGGYNSE
jgi:hypothetical protein